MSESDFLYLVKTIDDNKVQLVTTIETVDGVVMAGGKICAVLKRYTPPVDMSNAIADIQKYSAPTPTLEKKEGKKLSGKVYKDHLGNEFDSIFQMCTHYKVSETKYRSRLSNGWTQEEALTGRRKNKQIQDHLGNTFDSKTEMCQFYGISESLLRARLSAGRTLEQALLGMDDESEMTVEDHLGNKYKNVSQMCKAYGVRLDTYYQRKKRGWTLKEIFTGKEKTESPVIDHKGISYSSITEMCLKYGVRKSTYLQRISKGWSTEEALTGIKSGSFVYDHLGNIYLSQREMCDSYGIKLCTFRARMRNGYSLEAALTADIGTKRASFDKKVFDHLGNAYASINEMCIAYAVNPSTYRCRIRNGYTVEEALTGKRKNTKPKPPKQEESTKQQLSKQNKQQGPIFDHLGNVYNSILEMCQAYGIRVDTFNYRIEHGHTLEDALTLAPSSVTGISCQDHLGNTYPSQAEMARAYGLTKAQYMSRKRSGWDIERILTTPINEGDHGQSFVFGGVAYSSKKEFCRKNNLNYDMFVRRTKSGMSVEDALAAATERKAFISRPIIDHNGKTFSSIKEMCAYYGMSVSAYKYRIKHGYDIETALTVPLNSRKDAPSKEKKPLYYDHKGKGYYSKTEMCKAYGISLQTFRKRQAEGFTLRESLESTTSRMHGYIFKDHLGAKYNSLKEMCAAWKVSVHTYQTRISKGYSLEKALSEPDDSAGVTDHEGNVFPTIQSMCAAYGISVSLYQSRIRRGKSTKEALETPIEDNSIKYAGKTYKNLKDLAQKHRINAGTLRSRIKMGWTVKEAVTGIKKSRAYYDHTGKEYKSQKEMCRAYGVEPFTYRARIKKGWTVKEALLGKSNM